MPAYYYANPVRSLTAIAVLSVSSVLALATGCASNRAEADRHLRQALDVLTRSQNADALAAAGVIDVFVRGKPGAPDLVGRLQLIDRSVTLAPDRPDLAWLAAQACRAVAGCDPVPFETRLRTLDPGNGMGWLGGLARAYHAHDDVALDDLVADVGHSERVDLYWTTLASRLAAALAATHEVTQRVALLTVIGSLAAIALPEYQSASKACQGERLQRPGVLEACRGLAVSFERGDTLITAGEGAAIEQRLWPDGSPDWYRAVAERRRIHYWLKIEAQLIEPHWDAAKARSFARLLADHSREQDVFIDEFSAHGIPPNPPASWIDDSPT